MNVNLVYDLESTPKTEEKEGTKLKIYYHDTF